MPRSRRGGPRSGFVVDDDAAAGLLSTPAAAAHLETVLGSVVFHVREASPGPENSRYGTGDFRGSIGSSVRKVPNPAGGVRLEGRVFSTDPKWHLLEFGSVRNKPWRPFSTGLERSGLPFRRTPKG